ncbi:MAG: circularly permuted type 2 ATP-grasp protein [Verrucomicrobia bacterium]|nr:circularly permuted type 2 ATP-grasp protein [Verrucomicrobiota bacterium]MDA1005108.1 circularly permuted type 2 ATP-grasp protein [Verrucomicrobiota bacterium]
MSSKTGEVSAFDYRIQGDRRDEALSRDGVTAPEWGELFASLARHGSTVLSEWRNTAARISRERGLAYRPASIDGNPGEGWTLDPIPWIISPERWASLEAGISQRNRLYEKLLEDLYGPQRTLKERLFPAEILLSHPGYLRALHNLPPGNGIVGLGLSAFDVARDTAGQTFVVNDRFDRPFGLGLALENRTVVNKVLPRLFGRCGVRRIGQFFTDWFAYLGRCAPSGTAAPQVVILDSSEQGKDSELGFLANYCGISRAHPSDLTVRDGRVWIKALRGLVPVDVLWKTMAGRELDSLESENSSARGIAGIFEAIRGGGVAVASHPGSEALQSPGYYPYLPRLCRALLDEELLIPPVATWWCGQPKALSHVVENLATMVVKPAGPHHDFRTQYGSRLAGSELADLKAQILAHPTKFVGQEELLISTIPTSRPGGLVPRGAVVRMFSFQDGNQGIQVMPGGLARLSTESGVIVSTRNCGESKDVWVRSLLEEQPFSIASAISQTHLVSPDLVPSRTAENLFWTGRYAERTDVISRFAARVIDVRFQGFSQEHSIGQEHEDLLLQTLFKIFDCEGHLEDAKDADARLDLILRDRACPVGVTYNLERFFNATQTAREEWSPASTLTISACYEGWNGGPRGDGQREQFDSRLKMLQLNLSAFLGLNLDSMTRDEGWALLDAGRRLERSFIVSGLLSFLLKAELKEDMKALYNESILYFLDSVRTFQSRFHDTPSTELTVRLLLGEADYPKSVSYLLGRLHKVLRKLPTPGQQAHPCDLIEPWIEKMRRFNATMNEGKFRRRETILFLDELFAFLATLSDALTVSYFSHASKRR